MAAVAFLCVRAWPGLPLDLPAGDPQVQAAYARAVTDHVVRYGLLAVVPPLLLLGLGWALGRPRR